MFGYVFARPRFSQALDTRLRNLDILLEIFRGVRKECWIGNRQLEWSFKGFPGGAVVENLPANAGDTGSSPGLGRSHMPRSN